MVGTCLLTVSKEFSRLHSSPVCYLVVTVVVFNQMIFIFQVSSCESEHLYGREGTELSNIEEGAIHSVSLSPLQLCLKTIYSPVLTQESRGRHAMVPPRSGLEEFSHS